MSSRTEEVRRQGESDALVAVLLAPSGHVGVFVGIAVAAYTLPGVVGALALGLFLRHRPARRSHRHHLDSQGQGQGCGRKREK